MTGTGIDILGMGAVAVDDLLYVDRYMPPNTKAPIRSIERHFGGLTASALVAATRLGARCAYAGLLGYDELSELAVDNLRQQSIDLSNLKQTPEGGCIHSTILIGTEDHTRNIYHRQTGTTGALEDWPPTDVIESCKVLFVDHIGVPGMIRAAKIARNAGIPVVGDIERHIPGVPDLINLVDHLVISWEFARSITTASTPAEAARILLTPQRAITAITCGEQGCWYYSAGLSQPEYQPAFCVQVVDTNGCGDVFHGAYMAALVAQKPLTDRIRFASAAAAIKATRHGGQSGAPKLEEVVRFLAMQSD